MHLGRRASRKPDCRRAQEKGEDRTENSLLGRFNGVQSDTDRFQRAVDGPFNALADLFGMGWLTAVMFAHRRRESLLDEVNQQSRIEPDSFS